MIIAIDPGQAGAIVLINGDRLRVDLLPYENKSVNFEELIRLLLSYPKKVPVFLERAMPMAMGAKHAFNYGADFRSLEIALKILNFSVTHVEPSKWTKEMHQGINADLKPKAKSKLAVERLYPKLIPMIPVSPRAKKLHDGVIDAILIAGYGQRLLNKS